MKRRYLGLGVLTVSLGLVACGGRMAGHNQDPQQQQKFVEHVVGYLAGTIDATDKQKQELSATAKTLLGKVKPVRDAKIALHKELMTQWSSAKPDKARIDAAIDRLLKQAKTTSRELSASFVKVHQSLTPAQRKKLMEHMHAHHKKLRSRHHRRHGIFGH